MIKFITIQEVFVC